MPLLKEKIQKSKVKLPKPQKEIVWEGPTSNGPQGGVTQSMLGAFLVCRERFRLRNVLGLKVADSFNHRMEYGQMWHICEESLSGKWNWLVPLQNYCKSLCEKYPTQQEQIQHWYNVCKIQFPIYVEYWKKHPDVKNRKPISQEEIFCIPYQLPSGRTVYLRGKFDSVDQIGKLIYLQENKTKADIDEIQLKKQLQFDLQTMFYLTALSISIHPKVPAGIRYNVVRRPLSGGKGSITRWKQSKQNPLGETEEHFYGRVKEVIEEDPSYFFMRWKIEVSPQEVIKFQSNFLNPCLEQLCDWYNWITSPAGMKDPFLDSCHYRTPFGIYSPLTDGGSTDVDEYLSNGSELGLTYGNPLFTELQ